MKHLWNDHDSKNTEELGEVRGDVSVTHCPPQKAQNHIQGVYEEQI
jgi:hypothetical protein